MYSAIFYFIFAIVLIVYCSCRSNKPIINYVPNILIAILLAGIIYIIGNAYPIVGWTVSIVLVTSLLLHVFV